MVDGVDGSAVHVGRKTRRIKGTQIHHLKHWTHNGPTCLANLISPCDGHHWLVHEGGFTLVTRSPGRWALIAPDGVTTEPEAPAHTPTRALPHNPDITADAVTGHWTGDQLSHTTVLQWLTTTRTREAQNTQTEQAPTAKNVSAETSPAAKATTPQSFQFDQATIDRWHDNVIRLRSKADDPRTPVFYIDDEEPESTQNVSAETLRGQLVHGAVAGVHHAGADGSKSGASR